MTYETIRVDVGERIATVTLDRPAVRNAIDARMQDELHDALDRLGSDAAVGAVVFTGAGGRAFAAGADIGQLRRYGTVDGIDGRLQRLFDRVDGFEKPTIAAVNGFALGGGCELAMACDIRIAAEDGPVRAAGDATCRCCPARAARSGSARLVGTGRAIEMILTGRFVDAAEAHAIGLVTAVVPAAGLRAELRRHRRPILDKGPLAVRLAKLVVRAGMDADQRTGQVGRAAGAGAALHARRTRPRARARSSRSVRPCSGGGEPWRRSDLSRRRRRHDGLADRGWSAPSPARRRPSPTSAPTTRSTGRRPSCRPARPRRREGPHAGPARRRRGLRRGSTFSTDLRRGGDGADLVIEAAVENLDVKREVFARLDKVAPPHAILTTNSSAIMSSQLADATGRPDRVANMHFFNPALVMRCVEVVRGPDTSDATVDTVVDLARRLGKQPVVLDAGDPRASSPTGSSTRSATRRSSCWSRASPPSRTSTPPAAPRWATRWGRSS